MASWNQLGDLANVAQLTGLDAVRLIGMIAQAAATARIHMRNCRQFAQRLKLIGNLLEQLKISEIKRYPETREPLEQLEDALWRYFVLVESCQNRSYLYLLAMRRSIGYQLRKAQSEIDRYLLIVPLIVWVHNARVRERLEYIERDEREYIGQCEVIQHLIGVTQVVANTLPEKNKKLKDPDKVEPAYLDASNDREKAFDAKSRNTSTVSSSCDLISNKGSRRHEERSSDLLDCRSNPYLCLFLTYGLGSVLF